MTNKRDPSVCSPSSRDCNANRGVCEPRLSRAQCQLAVIQFGRALTREIWPKEARFLHLPCKHAANAGPLA